ncbi:MAG TPA: HAMP domain-containing sensor histidine kinase [Gammaproteobacteria bacterium]|nr:HAMP domain-containing sensor histidine kinase [Gammaproteobacteria bacterium]
MNRISLSRTTAFRLSMLYAGLFCLLTVFCLALVYWGTLREITTQIDAGLRAETDALLRLYTVRGAGSLRQTIDARSTPASLAQSDTGDSGPRQYLLTDATGKALAGTLAAWPVKADSTRSSWVTLHMTARGHEPGLDSAHRYRLRAHILLLPDGERLLVGQSLNETDELRDQMLTLMVIVAVLILVAGLGGGWWVGRSVVRRLEQVTGAADRIMAGDLTQRIPETEHRNDEFTLLAHKLNAMLERIELLMRNAREVTENIAHDLRSPLTRLRGAAEMALLKGDTDRQREALRNAIEQTDNIVATLNAILSIAQIESGTRAESARVDLTSVCHDAAELYEALAEEKAIHFASTIPETVEIKGNRQLIAQAVGNLLDNAIKYTPGGGTVALTLIADASDVRITVDDTGPGIPQDMRDKVLQRFVRLDTSRSLPGNGLGLSLVKAVADQHSAILQLDDNAPGLKVSLVFKREAIR